MLPECCKKAQREAQKIEWDRCSQRVDMLRAEVASARREALEREAQMMEEETVLYRSGRHRALVIRALEPD